MFRDEDNYLEEKVMKRLPFTAALAAAFFLTSFVVCEATAQNTPPGPPVTGVKTFVTNLSGTSVAPEAGAAQGSGRAFVVVNPNRGTVCWGFDVSGITPPTAAHIHEGATGASGPPVVPLDLTATCTRNVDGELARRITANPANFYVNVHNEDFPAGAVRGQLSD